MVREDKDLISDLMEVMSEPEFCTTTFKSQRDWHWNQGNTLLEVDKESKKYTEQLLRRNRDTL